jgi:RNA polymerase sigma factor (sigma-70 family)
MRTNRTVRMQSSGNGTNDTYDTKSSAEPLTPFDASAHVRLTPAGSGRLLLLLAPEALPDESSSVELAWRVHDDSAGNLHVVLSSYDRRTDGRVLTLCHGVWRWRVQLRSSDDLTPVIVGEAVVTERERRCLADGAALVVAAATSRRKRHADAWRCPDLWRPLYDRRYAILGPIARARIYGRLADGCVDDVVDDFLAARLPALVENFDPSKGSFIGFARTAFTRFCVRVGRGRRRRPDGEAIGDDHLEVADRSASLEARLADRLLIARLLATLPVRARALIAAKFVMELSYVEMREQFGFPVGSMKAWVHAARQQMRRQDEPLSGTRGLDSGLAVRGVARLPRLPRNPRPLACLSADEAAHGQQGGQV